MQYSSAPNPSPTLLSMGILGILVYGAFLVFYNNPAWSEPRWNREAFVWVAGLGSLASYLWGYQALRKQTDTASLSRIIIGFAGIFSLIALFTPPFHSTDIFGYINRGWEQLHYGMNPYVHPVGDIPGWTQDPMITDHWVNNPSPYGFLYMLFAKLLTALGQGNLYLTTLVFKLSNIVLVMLSAFGISQSQPDTASKDRALYLFLWNPLLIIHGLMNGHNDLWMGYLILMSLTFVFQERLWRWVLPGLSAATLIKYGAVVIIPFWILFLILKKAYRPLVEGLLMSLLLVPILGAPYLNEWQQFGFAQIGKNAQVTHSSLHAFFYHLYKTIDNWIPALEPYHLQARQAIKYALLCAYAGSYLWLGYRLFKNPERDRFLLTALLSVFLLIGFVSLKFYPWYLLMVFPAVFLLPIHHLLRRLLVLLTCTHLLSITLIGQAHLLNYGLMMLAPIGWVYWRQKDKPVAG